MDAGIAMCIGFALGALTMWLAGRTDEGER